MSTNPTDPAAVIQGEVGKVITKAEQGVDSVIFRATGYKLPWLTPAQVLVIVFPIGYSVASAIQKLVEHHQFNITNLWELLASTGTLGAIRLSQYLLKVLDPAVPPTETTPVPVKAS